MGENYPSFLFLSDRYYFLNNIVFIPLQAVSVLTLMNITSGTQQGLKHERSMQTACRKAALVKTPLL